MNTILNLDDFLIEDTYFIFKNKKWILNTSMNSFIAFVKWNEKLNNKDPESINIDNQNELIKIIVKDYESFLLEFNNLNVKNQVIVLQELVKFWNNEVSGSVNQVNEQEKKKD